MRLFIIEDEKEICDTVAKSLYDAVANDYMEKPFHLQELEARVRSLTRRKFVQKDVCLESGEIKFDTIRREAYAKGEMVSLTRKWYSGISASEHGQTGKPEGIDGACLGCICG